MYGPESLVSRARGNLSGPAACAVLLSLPPPPPPPQECLLARLQNDSFVIVLADNSLAHLCMYVKRESKEYIFRRHGTSVQAATPQLSHI